MDYFNESIADKAIFDDGTTAYTPPFIADGNTDILNPDGKPNVYDAGWKPDIVIDKNELQVSDNGSGTTATIAPGEQQAEEKPNWLMWGAIALAAYLILKK